MSKDFDDMLKQLDKVVGDMVDSRHKTYITFGFQHVHMVRGKYLDHNRVAVINSASQEEGRELAFKFFGDKWCGEYPEKYWDANKLALYPGGLVEVN